MPVTIPIIQANPTPAGPLQIGILGAASDLILMDVIMPQLSGIEAPRRILTAHPAVQVLALSMHADRRFVENMLRAGTSG